MIEPNIDICKDREGTYTVSVRMKFDKHNDSLEFLSTVVKYVAEMMNREPKQ